MNMLITQGLKVNFCPKNDDKNCQITTINVDYENSHFGFGQKIESCPKCVLKMTF